ncbi:MAG TPA: beta-eliminating lyase-related protein [Fimbriimonas sp.]|nr:beta-eliminating lyase-related protein [Fimbriimonas sp.]
MNLPPVDEIVASCTRFLSYGRPIAVRERVREIADSPLSLIRNDGYGKGGFVAELENEVAELLGKEAAAFMPSGTMAQQIALRIYADGSGIRDVAFHPTCHLEVFEFMAYRELHGLSGILLGDPERLFTLDDLRRVDQPVSTLLIELPQRMIGGQLPTWDELAEICEEARSRGMKLHMDGARLWECQPYYDRSYAEISSLFDSVYVSFYKILNGLPGAMLAGSASMIEQARVWLRRHGGNLQQQSPSAISAKLGMDRYLPRIPRYVKKAAEIAELLRCFDGIQLTPSRPPTNMMHVRFMGDANKIVEAALRVAHEDRIWLFAGLGEGNRWELAAAEGALEISKEEIEHVFRKLLTLSG